MSLKKNVFIERLTWFSILMASLKEGKDAQYYFFDQERSGITMAGSLVRFGVLTKFPEELCFSLAKMFDQNGVRLYERIQADAVRVASQASATTVPRAFFETFKPLVDRTRLELFFYKVIGHEIQHVLIFMHAARGKTTNNGVFYVCGCPWASALVQYGKTLHFDVVVLGSTKYSIILKWLRKFFHNATKKITVNVGNVPTQPLTVPMASIGVWYTGKTLNDDISKRNELFWLLSDDISPKDVLLYFERKDILPTGQGIKNISALGVKLASFMDLQTVIPVSRWVPGERYKWQRTLQGRRLVMACVKSFLSGKLVSFFYIERMMWFIQNYALWHDFFAVTGIKVNLSGN